ncbi:MAG: methylated-DNA--[protein]-cysteine S-methyltransferase, partial [Candidatus Baltobacteraceae bacterium]
GLSPAHLQRRFKAAIGVSPKAYAQTIKRERLRTALKSAASATHAIYDAGLSSPSQAYAKSGSPLGMTPAQFAAGGKNVRIAFAVVRSAIGMVLVAATERGVCRVDIDHAAGALEARLHAEFPHAAIARENDALASAASLIVAYLSGSGPWPVLPLDVRGTAFQTRVWDAMRALAPGTAVSYSDLARIIGSPRSARAVANACAANSIALLIPCHRIVPQAGGVGGYRWSPARKERLLELERGL